MPFGKMFFESLSERINKYFKIFRCGTVTVTLKAYGKEYNLYRTLSVDQDTITFIYYDKNKSEKILGEKPPFDTAFPALTLPYEVIESVEFNPKQPRARATAMGFKPSD
ncbi:MAG TPA: hypothetical protein VEI50_04740 [Nitrospiraceae bacterium]|nr:hypothetical protein [Nitrospiraceae bacterium]